jgi:hypothetical protein
LAAAAKLCSATSANSMIGHSKSSFISYIVSHFIATRTQLISSFSSNVFSYHAFVKFTEETYGCAVAILLREPLFALALVIN